MKTTYTILVFSIVCGFSIVNVSCKRHRPQHDEIERLINDTHSVIWKCPECAFGYGLNVLCGTSIYESVQIQCVDCVEGFNYSDSHGFAPCETCRKCAENEETSGSCSKEEDTTKCLGRCHKGFYWEELTASCHPCSYCCGENFQHKKQCENAALQCQQTYIQCPHPTNAGHDILSQENQNDSQRKTISVLEMVVLGIFSVLLIIIVFVLVAILVMWRLLGWQETKIWLRRYFCSCCHTGEVSLHFDNIVFDQGNVEPTICKECEMHEEEATDQMGPLKSGEEKPTNQQSSTLVQQH